MALLLRRTSAEGASIDREVEGVVTVGRATDNHIELPGLRVALHHLRLTQVSTTTLLAECTGSAEITVNDRPGQRTVDIDEGDEIRIGPHRILFGTTDEGVPLLEVHEASAGATGADEHSITTLAESGWKMRGWAWGVAGVVFVLALLAPLLLSGVSVPILLSAWLPSDQIWSSGRIGDAHASFGRDCRTCHASLFRKVADTSCLACHTKVAQHGDHADAMQQSGLDHRRCASCHFEHSGRHGMVARHDGLCIDCHGTPDHLSALAKSPAIHDFEHSHPPFAVEVGRRQDGAAADPVRVALDENARDTSGLFFSHHLHLEEKGLRGDKKNPRETLTCASCHEPDRSGSGFRPPRFEDHCQRCHQLDVEFGGRPMRLPHGHSDVVRAQLEAAIAHPASVPILDVSPPAPVEDDAAAARRRPAEVAPRGAGLEILSSVDGIFEKRICAKCHEVDLGPPKTVGSPQLRQSWMVRARFTHQPHRTVSCETCHAAKDSNDSDQLVLPQIDSCRACHTTADSIHSVRTPCVDCHRFHQATTLEMGPIREPVNLKGVRSNAPKP